MKLSLKRNYFSLDFFPCELGSSTSIQTVTQPQRRGNFGISRRTVQLEAQSFRRTKDKTQI